MPITKTTGYLASDGIVYPTYEEARKAELLKLFTPVEGSTILTPELCVEWVLNNKEDVVEWITTGPTSRPGARKRAGTTAPKRAAKQATKVTQTSYIRGDGQVTLGKKVVEPATEAQATAGFKAMQAATDQPVEAVEPAAA